MIVGSDPSTSPAEEVVRDQRLSFLVVGMARSGTTLVQRLASELDAVWVPPETHFWPVVLHRGDRVPLARRAARQLLADVADRMRVGHDEATVETLARRLPRHIRPWQLFERLVAHLSEPRPVLGEKTPNHLLVVGQLAAAHPQLRVIAVVRDPRSVHASLLTVPWGNDDPVRNAWRWRLRYQAVADLQHALGSRMLLLRYEDVAREPDDARLRIARFLGVDPTFVPIAPQSRLFGEWETWKSRAIAPIDSSRAREWEADLEPDVARRIWAITADVARRLGYDGPDVAATDEGASLYVREQRLFTAPLHVDREVFR